jgi:hypothetical protein
MPWFRFDRAFDWKPQSNVTVGYLPGQVKLVTTTCATAAEAKCAGKRVKKPESERRNGNAAERGQAS